LIVVILVVVVVLGGAYIYFNGFPGHGSPSVGSLPDPHGAVSQGQNFLDAHLGAIVASMVIAAVVIKWWKDMGKFGRGALLFVAGCFAAYAMTKGHR